MTLNAQLSPLAADLDQVLMHTQSLWEPLRGGAVFITGGTGFFGRWLLESFAEANRRLELGAQAVVLTRRPENFRAAAPELAEDESIQLVQGDVRSLETSAICAQLDSSTLNPFSHVIHAASETSVPANRDHPLIVLETLFEGTRRTLEFADQAGAKNFLLVSSGAVYGEQPTDLSHVAETFSGAPDVAAPLSAYGEGKRVAELLCSTYSRTHGLDCRIARCFAFVGPHLALDAHYAVGNFIRDALAGRPIQIKGDGTPFRSYLYAADLAAWLWTILLSNSASGAYNVGSDEAHALRDVAEYVSRNSPHSSPVNVAEAPDLKRAAPRYVPDVSRAQQELDLQVWTPLNAAVRKTLEFHQRTKTYEK